MDTTILKLASDSVLGLFLICTIYLLRPILKEYLQQQVEQLRKIGEAMDKLSEQQETNIEMVGQLAESQRILADRLAHVENLLAVDSRQTPVSSQSQPARRTSARKRPVGGENS